MPRLNTKPISAAFLIARLRMLREHASNGCPFSHRSLANHAVSLFQGNTVADAGSGMAATSSSLTSWGTPSRAAPVNSSDPFNIWSRCPIGTTLHFERP